MALGLGWPSGDTAWTREGAEKVGCELRWLSPVWAVLPTESSSLWAAPSLPLLTISWRDFSPLPPLSESFSTFNRH